MSSQLSHEDQTVDCTPVECCICVYCSQCVKSCERPRNEDLDSHPRLEPITLAYKRVQSHLQVVTKEFRQRDRRRTDSVNLQTTSESWDHVKSQDQEIPAYLCEIIESEIERDASISDGRSDVKRAKDGLRRILHILSDGCHFPHVAVVTKPASLLPQHYRTVDSDFDEVDLEARRASNEPLGEAVAAKITATLCCGSAVSATMGIGEAATAIWQHLPGAGSRITRLLRAAIECESAALSSTQATPTAQRWETWLNEAACAAQCQEISPGVFLGSYRSALDGELLTALDVSCVVNCTAYDFDYPPPARHTVRCAVDQECYSCRQLRPALRQVGEWVSAGRRVLIHCVEGRFRSATFAAAWLMRDTGLTADCAAARVREMRPWARPKRFALRAIEAHGGLRACNTLAATAPPPLAAAEVVSTSESAGSRGRTP